MPTTVVYFVLFLSVLECSGAPAESGVGFSIGSRGRSSFSSRAEAIIEKDKITGDVKGTASGDLNSHARGGAYTGSDGEIIGVNAGINSKISGAIEGGLHGEIENKVFGIITAVNSSLNSTGVAGLTGHANIATGDDEFRQIAEFEHGKIPRTSIGHGSTTNLGTLISVAGNVLENFWLYFWVTVACVIFLVCCCLSTVCAFYWKLVREIQGLKITPSAGNKNVSEHKDIWDSKLY